MKDEESVWSDFFLKITYYTRLWLRKTFTHSIYTLIDHFPFCWENKMNQSWFTDLNLPDINSVPHAAHLPAVPVGSLAI